MSFSTIGRVQEELKIANDWVKSNIGIDLPNVAARGQASASDLVINYAGKVVDNNETCATTVKVYACVLASVFTLPYFALSTLSGITMNTLNRDWDNKIQKVVNKTNDFVHQFGISSGILNPRDGEEVQLNEVVRKRKAVKLVTASSLALASYFLLPFPLPVAMGVTTGLVMGKDIGKSFFDYRAQRIDNIITVQRCARRWLNQTREHRPLINRHSHSL